MSTLVLISDLNVLGSGYKSIVVGVAMELSSRGHDVKLLGANYKGTEHHFPFSVIPLVSTSSYDTIWGSLKNMKELNYSDVIVLADIPIVNRIVDRCGDLNVQFSGLFPLEAPPLIDPIAMHLMSLRGRFLMTRFGQEEFHRRNVQAEFVPIPVGGEWTYPSKGQVQEARKTLGVKNFTIVTVAENQERKNLSATAEIISRLPDVQWVLVTRTKAQWGWDIGALLETFGILDRTLVIEKGIPQKALLGIYHAADAMLITSKAEGLGMPVLEAMACGVPVVAPKHTAFEEHLSDGRGFLFDNVFQYVDPFGNQNRYFPDIDAGVRACQAVMNLSQEERFSIHGTCSAYLDQRSWKGVGDVICKTLEL